MHCALASLRSQRQLNEIKWKTLPILFGVVAYEFSRISVMFDLERAMHKPEQFLLLTKASHLIVCLVLIFYGTVGYLKFGNNSNPISLLNLPLESPFTIAAITLVVISQIIAYAIQVFPAFAVLENMLFTVGTQHLALKTNALRIFVVLLTCASSIVFHEQFGIFLSIVGSIGFPLLTFVLPPLFYLKVFFRKCSTLIRTLCVLYIVFGVALFLVSFLTSVVSLIE
jgi:proton-coupled amino acid transporter